MQLWDDAASMNYDDNLVNSILALRYETELFPKRIFDKYEQLNELNLFISNLLHNV